MTYDSSGQGESWPSIPIGDLSGAPLEQTGLPPGGLTGQLLRKLSNADGHVGWGAAQIGTSWGSISGTISGQADLQAALDGKSANGHIHPITEVSGLQTALNGKSDTGHTHSGLAPIGGTTGQVLAKNSNSNYDFSWVNAGAAGSASWGAITGTLSAQVDLQNALDAKSPTGHTHSGLAPVGGTTGQVLKKNSGTNHDYSWQPDDTGGTPSWGGITGTLSNQTDLNTALNGKASSVHTHNGLAPVGGTTGQVLKKNSGTDHDYSWQVDATGGSPVWGSIAGTLADQTDLNAALAGKANTGHTHNQSSITNLTTDLAAKVNKGPASHDILEMWRGTEAEYNALTPKVATTLYVVTP